MVYTKAICSSIALESPFIWNICHHLRHEESVPNMALWGKYEGFEVDIQYDTELRNQFAFWSLPVYNEWFQAIREELGLMLEPDFYITFGRQFNWQPIPASARRYAYEIRREREQWERQEMAQHEASTVCKITPYTCH